jgi:hypothetical protein
VGFGAIPHATQWPGCFVVGRAIAVRRLLVRTNSIIPPFPHRSFRVQSVGPVWYRHHRPSVRPKTSMIVGLVNFVAVVVGLVPFGIFVEPILCCAVLGPCGHPHPKVNPIFFILNSAIMNRNAMFDANENSRCKRKQPNQGATVSVMFVGMAPAPPSSRILQDLDLTAYYIYQNVGAVIDANNKFTSPSI